MSPFTLGTGSSWALTWLPGVIFTAGDSSGQPTLRTIVCCRNSLKEGKEGTCPPYSSLNLSIPTFNLFIYGASSSDFHCKVLLLTKLMSLKHSLKVCRRKEFIGFLLSRTFFLSIILDVPYWYPGYCNSYMLYYCWKEKKLLELLEKCHNVIKVSTNAIYLDFITTFPYSLSACLWSTYSVLDIEDTTLELRGKLWLSGSLYCDGGDSKRQTCTWDSYDYTPFCLCSIGLESYRGGLGLPPLSSQTLRTCGGSGVPQSSIPGDQLARTYHWWHSTMAGWELPLLRLAVLKGSPRIWRSLGACLPLVVGGARQCFLDIRGRSLW